MTSAKINIEATLFCGQSFAWTKCEGRYEAVIDRRLISFDEASFPALLESDPALQTYFDCSFDYAAAQQYLASCDEHLSQCIAAYPGIRILRQDPWETLISFILSQNNNIARIRGLYRTLSETYGTPVGKGHYSFPQAQQLLSVTEEDLRKIGAGFRAPYLIDAIKCHHILDEVADLDDSEAYKALMTIAGVGIKVASCTLLFAYGRFRLFPIDVWMKRILGQFYGGEVPPHFAPYEGLAQQYLFHYHRSEERRR